MAEITTNINLILPEDRAEEWGDVLNTNFKTIDNKVAAAYTLAAKDFISTGIYEMVGTVTHSESTIYIPRIRFFSPLIAVSLAGSNLPGTLTTSAITYNATDFTLGENPYKRYFFGYYNNNGSWSEIHNEDIETFDITSGKYILFGYFVVYSDNGTNKFADGITTFKPWFANYSTNDRAIDMKTHGTLKGGYINVANTAGVGATPVLKCTPISKYIWAHEGINYTNSVAPHFVYNYAKQVNPTGETPDNHLQFFRACSNSRVDSSELILYDTIDYSKYYNGTEKVNVPSNKYTIQRYCILENGNSVIFYGNEYFNSKADAESGFASLPELATMIIAKEVARIIVSSSGENYYVYNLQENEEKETNDILNMDLFTLYHNENNTSKSIKFNTNSGNHRLLVDDKKVDYTIADEADIKSSGIIPTTASCTKDTDGYIFNMTIGFINGSNITYETFTNKKWTSGTIGTGWKRLSINSAGTFLVEDAGDIDSNVTLAYFYSNNSVINLFTFRPRMFNTSPAERNELNHDPIQTIKCRAVTNTSHGLELENGTIYSEGINFNQSDSNILDILYNNSVTFDYIYYVKEAGVTYTAIDLNKTSIESKYITNHTITNIPNGKFSIQKILLTTTSKVENNILSPDIRVLVEYGSNLYDSKAAAESALFIPAEKTLIPSFNGLEIGKIIVDSSNNNYTYYTNQSIFGNINLTIANTRVMDRNNPDNEFNIYRTTGGAQPLSKYTFDASGLTGEVKIKSSASTTIANKPILLDGIGTETFTHSATENGYIKWDNVNTKYITKQPDLSEFTDSNGVLNSAGATINNNLSANNHIITTNNSGLFSAKIWINDNAPTVPANSGWSLSEIIWMDSSEHTSDPSKPYLIKFYDGVKWQIVNSWQ